MMLVFEDIIFPLWNLPVFCVCFSGHADFKTTLVVKIGPILAVDVNLNHPKS